MTEEPSISDLLLSTKRIGMLYLVLLDKDGNVIDGRHRLAADADWSRIKLNHVTSERDKLLARLVSNVCRRTVGAEEKKEILGKLGKIYVEEGEQRGRIAYRIAEETGMSYRWVMKYLPSYLKERAGLGGPSTGFAELVKCKTKNNICKVARRSTIEPSKLLSPLGEGVIGVKSYANTRFVNLTFEKRIYEKFQRMAEQLGVAAETIIWNGLLLILEEVERMASETSSSTACGVSSNNADFLNSHPGGNSVIKSK